MRVLLLSTVSILSSVLTAQAIAQTPARVQRVEPPRATVDVPPPPIRVQRAAPPRAADDVLPPRPLLQNGSITRRPIVVGQTISGRIGADDPKLDSDNSSYELYRVQIPAGRRVTATLTSTAFQPVLSLGEFIDEDCEGCTTNVGETDKPAVVSRTTNSGGTLELRVNTMNAGDTGAFTLTVSAVAPPTLRTQPIVFGQSKTGELTATDATSGDEDATTDAYALRLTANQSVQIDLSSSEFDPKLVLIAPDGEEVEEDDDAGPGNSARIRFTAPRAGLYQVRAMALSDSGLGAYTLRAGARPPVLPFPPARTLVLGTATSGEITERTPSYDNDGEETVAVRYAFNAVAGTTYRVTANKKDGSELDPRVSVGKVEDGDFSSLASDDDGGDDTNATLRYRATESGRLIVEVSPVGDNLGAYDVKVAQLPPDRAPANPIPMTLETDYKGSLNDGGARTSDDVLFTDYSIALKSGQRIVVDLKVDGESALDPKLEIGRGRAADFEQSAEDDDGGSDLNSRLRFVAPSDGTYIIRATSLGSSSEGAYVVRVAVAPPPILPPEPKPIQAGQALSGSLATTDPTLNDENYYDRYVLTGRVGETYDIIVTAEDLDVIVGARSALREDDEYETDDDSGGGTNAKLTYTITTAGPQTIRVTSVNAEDEGDYTISVVKK
jgi:Bacterial pre-peptidase C-terminal domain